jgi:hypothetical protein
MMGWKRKYMRAVIEGGPLPGPLLGAVHLPSAEGYVRPLPGLPLRKVEITPERIAAYLAATSEKEN